VADVVDLEEVDDAFLDLGAQFVLLARARRPVAQRRQQPGLQVRVAAELDVVEHRQAAEQRDVLEAARQPHASRAAAPAPA
jgi:hypothetical protein